MRPTVVILLIFCSIFTDNQPTTNGAWSLYCPHVIDAQIDHVHTSVTWMHKDRILLKIEDGHCQSDVRLSSYSSRQIRGKIVVEVGLVDDRYKFSYDELAGDFQLVIMPVFYEQDEGLWQCHVTVSQLDGTVQTLTSRSTIRKSDDRMTEFSRPKTRNQPVEMLRNTAHQSVVFDRITVTESMNDRYSSKSVHHRQMRRMYENRAICPQSTAIIWIVQLVIIVIICRE